jgi:transcriptional regulator GlxA family with amidase domain
MAAAPFRIVEVLFDNFTQLDFTGPHQVLSRLPGAEVIVASLHGGAVNADCLTIAHSTPLAQIDRCDLLVIPGGLGVHPAMEDEAFMAEVQRLGSGARYLASICTGSLILGAAGFLAGRRAASHWAWRDLLSVFGATPDAGRVVRDGNVLTGGGVTAGIDLALTIAAEVAGPDVAQTIQLTIEYAPAPPFDAGRPETAPPHILAAVQAHLAQVAPDRRASAERAASRLEAV